jgi:hypothetical protein
MADPYISGLSISNSNLAGNPYTLQAGISADDMKRVNQELQYWKFYKGDHWSYKRPDGEPQNTLNYSARFVDKSVAFLMGKGFTINVEKGAEDIVKRPLDEVWDDNQRELLGLEMGQAGGVSGNAWIKVVVQEYDSEDDPVMAELFPKGRIRLLLLPGHACFPEWNQHDKDRMERIKIIYPILQDIPGKPGQKEILWFREDIDRKEIVQYLNSEEIDRRPNDLGEIPVVRAKNILVANESLGKSDLQDIMTINREFNEKTTDVSDIINYHAAPITLIFGAKSNNLSKGANKVWGGLPKDAKVENLELKSDLASSMAYIELLKKSLFEIGNMPEDAFGASTNVSNTSGVALHIKNQPLMDLTNMKRLTYGEAIEQINRIIVKYLYLYGMNDFEKEKFDGLTPRQKWVYSTAFPSPLPKDELIQMQLIAQKLTLQLTTRIDALKELGERDAAGKLEEIKKEFVEWQSLMFETQAEYTENSNGNTTLKRKGALSTNVGGIVPKFEQAGGETP